MRTLKYEEFLSADEREILGRINARNNAAYKREIIPSRDDLTPEEKRVLAKERAYYALKNKEAWAGMDLKEETFS